MMRGRRHIPITAIALAVALSACASNVVEDTSRDLAKDAVNAAVASRFPGVNAAPYTDCIIDNATGEEVLSLAQFALTQNSNAATDLVFKIAARPETTACIAEGALASLLG